MSTRSFVLLSVLGSALTLSPAVFAQSTSSSGSPSASSSGSASSNACSGVSNAYCTVDSQNTDGFACQTCDPGSNCGSVPDGYGFACCQSDTVAVYCNGPSQTSGSTTDAESGGCSVRAGGSGDSWKNGVACSALALAAAVYLRRKR